MWGAASFLFRCARCSCTPVWVRGSRSSRRCPYRVAVPPEGGGAPPALRGRRAAPVAPQLRWVRGGGSGGRAPARSRTCVGGGGGNWGGPFGPLAMPPVGRGGGAAWQSWPWGTAIGGGVAPLPRTPLPRAGFSRRPSLGPPIPRPLSRGAGRPGMAVRVSGQWLAGCGAAGSPLALVVSALPPAGGGAPSCVVPYCGGGVGRGAQPTPPTLPYPPSGPSPAPSLEWGLELRRRRVVPAVAPVGEGAAQSPGEPVVGVRIRDAEHRSPLQEGRPRRLPVGPRRPDH